MALKCLDGDKQNCDPANWEAVPRALLPRLAGGNRYRRVLAFDDAAPEVRLSILAIAKLEHAARQRAKPNGGDAQRLHAQHEHATGVAGDAQEGAA